MASDENTYVLNFILIGGYGCGKSSTGNKLTGQNNFVVSSSPSIVDRKVEIATGECDKHKFQVVDGPSIRNVNASRKREYGQELIHQVKDIIKRHGSIAAFLYVIRLGMKFTAEEKQILDFLKTVFGNGFTNNMIVIMTGGDSFQRSMEAEGRADETFENWCAHQAGELGSLYIDCKKRFVLVNNIENDQEKIHEKVCEIIDMAVNLGQKYSLSNLLAAEEKFNESIGKSISINDEDVEDELNQLIQVINISKLLFVQKQRNVERFCKELEQNIHKTGQASSKEYKGLLELAKLTEVNSHNPLKLRELMQSLNKFRKGNKCCIKSVNVEGNYSHSNLDAEADTLNTSTTKSSSFNDKVDDNLRELTEAIDASIHSFDQNKENVNTNCKRLELKIHQSNLPGIKEYKQILHLIKKIEHNFYNPTNLEELIQQRNLMRGENHCHVSGETNATVTTGNENNAGLKRLLCSFFGNGLSKEK